MVGLIIKFIGEGPYFKDKMEELSYKGGQYNKMFFKGDIVKCVPGHWYKSFKVPLDCVLLLIKKREWNHDKSVFTASLFGGTENKPRLIARRRFFVDLRHKKLWKFSRKQIVKVRDIKSFILDKEGDYGSYNET